MTHHKSEDYKLQAVKYYLVEDNTQEEVCKVFECSRRSLMRWVEQYKKKGNLERNNRTPIAYKVKREHIRFIKDEINKNKTITMEDLLFLLKRKYPSLSLSRFHLNRVVNNNNITLKLTRIRHEPTHRWGKEININEKLDEFYKEISRIIIYPAFSEFFIVLIIEFSFLCVILSRAFDYFVDILFPIVVTVVHFNF
jgi:transposase